MLFCNVLFYGHSYLLHGLSFVRRVWGLFLIEVMFYIPLVGFIPLRLCFMPHCYYTLIVGLFQAVYVWIFPFMVHSQCGIVYCVYYFINTKNLPTDFHWSMGSGAYPTLCIVGYGGMFVCRHCVSICFAYIIIIQFSGMKSNKKNVF